MPKYFDITDKELANASLPTADELAALAQCLGVMITTSVPILECVYATGEATSSPRLRLILRQAADSVRVGAGMTEPMSTYHFWLDPELIEAIQIGEREGTLGQALMRYARTRCNSPNLLLERLVGRSVEIRTFTCAMAEFLKQGSSIADGLERSTARTSPRFRNLLHQVRERHLKSNCLSEDLDVVQTRARRRVFDRIYLNVVRGGERSNRIASAFEILALP